MAKNCLKAIILSASKNGICDHIVTANNAFQRVSHETTGSPYLWISAEYAFQGEPTEIRKDTLLYTKGKGPFLTLCVGDVFSTFKRK